MFFKFQINVDKENIWTLYRLIYIYICNGFLTEPPSICRLVCIFKDTFSKKHADKSIFLAGYFSMSQGNVEKHVALLCREEDKDLIEQLSYHLNDYGFPGYPWSSTIFYDPFNIYLIKNISSFEFFSDFFPLLTITNNRV